MNEFSKQNALIVEINSGKNVVINVENNHMNILYVRRSLKRTIEFTI